MVHRFLFFIRVIFPSWNFFDQVGPAFKLSTRSQETEAWQEIVFSSQFHFSSLFFNPSLNLKLAQKSLVEHFSQDVQRSSTEDILHQATYKMLGSLIKGHWEAQNKKNLSFQFKIEVSHKKQDMILFISDWIS